jgi:thiol-disulfide isomerase/thioredoxin
VSPNGHFLTFSKATFRTKLNLAPKMKKSISQISAILLFIILTSFTLLQDTPKGLMKGDKAPDFEVKDISGNLIKLSEKLKAGPVILVFYRGQWCPHCNKYLSHMEDSLKMIQAKGASVIAVSPETYEGVKQTIKKTK